MKIFSNEEIFNLDGTKIKLMDSKDLDGDGSTGGIEHLGKSFRNETHIINPTELGETLKEANRDELEADTRMSSIDMKSRLEDVEISSILSFDSLVSLKFLPRDALFITRQKKRLEVSKQGKGREEAVQMVRGVKDAESRTGMMNSFGNMFSGGKK